MANLADHHGSKFVKLALIGDSGTGKTGALVSLVQAGYKLKILDLDNGLDALREWAKVKCPDKLANVDYETYRDKYKVHSSQGLILDGQPKAFTNSLKLLEKWTDETKPCEWGEETIFVIDSLTAYGKAAFEWAKGMNSSAKDPRQWFYLAQQAVEDTVALLTGEAFKTNVIIISHVTYDEWTDGTTKGTMSAVGKALGPKLAKYLNTLVLAEKTGKGDSVVRSIRTAPTSVIDLKTPGPGFEVTLPLGTGLAEIFKKLKTA
jgi:hypothetical protein